MKTQRWHVDIFIGEHEGRTRAEARLRTLDKTHLVGVGTARCNPADTEVPEIGDELAVARALSDLSHQTLDTAVGDIEEMTNRPAHLQK